MKKPVKLSEILSQHLKNSIGEESSKGLDSIVVCRTCREILGSMISSYISNLSFNNGELRITVTSPVLKNDLFMQRSFLMEKVNSKLPSPIVVSVYIL